jgi:hypothetical protein
MASLFQTRGKVLCSSPTPFTPHKEIFCGNWCPTPPTPGQAQVLTVTDVAVKGLPTSPHASLRREGKTLTFF